MDWMQYTSSLVGSLAWPMALVAVVWVFRHQFRSLATRIQEVSFPGGAAKFADQLEETREMAQATKPVALPALTEAPLDNSAIPPPPTATPPADNSQDYDEILNDPIVKLAQEFPAAAVLEAWKEVEDYLNAHVKIQGTHTVFRDSQGGRYLTENLFNAPDVLELFKKLRETRNAAVHSTRAITSGEALEFRALCKEFLSRLRRIRPLPKYQVKADSSAGSGET